MLLFFWMFSKASLCLYVRLSNGLDFSSRLRFQSFSKNIFSSLVLLFLFGKKLDLFFTSDSSVVFLLSLNISISLSLRSNSLRSFFRSAILLFGAGQNFRPNFSRLISSFVNVYVDRFITLGFVSSKLVFLFGLGLLKNNDCFF